MLAANSLIANGESSYVKQYLWTGSESSLNGGAIKYMLDYIVTANNWESTTCDLWVSRCSDTSRIASCF